GGRGRSEGAGRGGNNFVRRKKVGNRGADGAGGCVSCGSASWGCGTFVIAYCFLDAARRVRGPRRVRGDRLRNSSGVAASIKAKGKRQKAKIKTSSSRVACPLFCLLPSPRSGRAQRRLALAFDETQRESARHARAARGGHARGLVGDSGGARMRVEHGGPPARLDEWRICALRRESVAREETARLGERECERRLVH